jgi:hypothetical protein
MDGITVFFARHVVWNTYGMTRDYRSQMLSERFIVKYKQETVFLITANIPPPQSTCTCVFIDAHTRRLGLQSWPLCKYMSEH